MLKPLTITIVCDDKPGIVDTIATAVSAHEGNWLESQLVQLGGKFAGVVRVDAPEEKINDLTKALEQLQTTQFLIHIEDASEVITVVPNIAHFSLSGPDKKGIVKEISSALANQSINVKKLTTRVDSMPYSGNPMFVVSGTMDLGDQQSLDEVNDQFDEIANQLGLDYHIEE